MWRHFIQTLTKHVDEEHSDEDGDAFLNRTRSGLVSQTWIVCAVCQRKVEKGRSTMQTHLNLVHHSSGSPQLTIDEYYESFVSTRPLGERRVGAMQHHTMQVLRDNLECNICFNILIEATSLNPCGHSFCRQCIDDWHESLASKPNPESLICPNCRRSGQPHPILGLRQLVGAHS
jgi:hypothetical protein